MGKMRSGKFYHQNILLKARKKINPSFSLMAYCRSPEFPHCNDSPYKSYSFKLNLHTPFVCVLKIEKKEKKIIIFFFPSYSWRQNIHLQEISGVLKHTFVLSIFREK